jgi:hypothetical protein
MNYMKAFILIFLSGICLNIHGQNLIGYHVKDIRLYMKEKEKNMAFRGFTYNSTFKYLKFENEDESQTLLFFLTADSICKSVRLVCDKSLKAAKIKELDSKYKKEGENNWSDVKNDKKYFIELKEEDWSFNVTFKLND